MTCDLYMRNVVNVEDLMIRVQFAAWYTAKPGTFTVWRDTFRLHFQGVLATGEPFSFFAVPAAWGIRRDTYRLTRIGGDEGEPANWGVTLAALPHGRESILFTGVPSDFDAAWRTQI